MKFILILVTCLFSQLALSVEFKIKKYEGDIFVNSKPLVQTTILKVGDMIEAKGKKSYIHISDDLGSNFLIRNGQMQLEKFTKKESIINLIRGKFFHYLNPTKKKTSNFKLKTRNAVMGVRGTKYMVETNNQLDYLCVCEGAVGAQRTIDKNEHLVKKGEDLFFYKGKKEAHVQKANNQMFNMTAEEFNMMGFPVKKK